jgi:hypothetical protein
MQKTKAIPVTVRGGLEGCESEGFEHCLDSRLIDGSKVARLKRRLPFSPLEDS